MPLQAGSHTLDSGCERKTRANREEGCRNRKFGMSFVFFLNIQISLLICTEQTKSVDL